MRATRRATCRLMFCTRVKISAIRLCVSAHPVRFITALTTIPSSVANRSAAGRIGGVFMAWSLVVLAYVGKWK